MQVLGMFLDLLVLNGVLYAGKHNGKSSSKVCDVFQVLDWKLAFLVFLSCVLA